MFLELEFKYWEDNHKVNFVKDGIQYSMFRYNCEEDGPRPESYFEDFTVFTYKYTELYNAIHKLSLNDPLFFTNILSITAS